MRGTNQRAGVAGVGGVVLQVAGEAKVGHLAHQVAVDQDVAGGQVAVDVVHLRQVLHARRDPPHHAYQLDHGELPVILLLGKQKCKPVISPPHCSGIVNLNVTSTEKRNIYLSGGLLITQN